VAGIHLDTVAEPRLRHVGELETAISRHVDPDVAVIVAGDVNDVPGSATWEALSRTRPEAFAAAGSGDGFTSSARRPHKRLDAAFVDPRLHVTAATVLDGPDVEIASDHRPVLVELEL
jgi:endonuclease/exonuclease/phosphatase family metal-dependent hydrolase